MTVPATTRRSPVYSGNGVTLVFPFSFKVFLPTDIQVIVTSVGGAIAPATYITDYSVTLNPDQTVAPGGSISYQPGFVPLPTGAKLVIIGNLPYSQTLALPGGGNFNPVAIENNFDRTEMQIQQLASSLDAAISVPVGETVPPLPAAAVRAGYVLGFDSLGNPVATIPTSGAAGTLVTDLANSVAPSKGAGQIGFGYALAYGAGTVGKWLKDLATTAGAGFIGVLDTANYFNAATLEAVLAEIGNPKGQLQGDGVNVLRYIPPAEWAAITAYTSSTNLYTYLQAAFTAEPNLLFPDGLFNTGTKLIPRTDAKIRGMRRRGTKLNGTTANIILEFPYLTVDPHVENIWFTGAGTTGIAVANTAGAFHDYLVRPHIIGCDFSWEQAFGVNADWIYSTLEKSTFGFYGTVGSQPAPGASTMVAVRTRQVTGNPPNLNRVNDCNFNAGSLLAPGFDILGSVLYHFTNCDFSFGGQALGISSAALVKFNGCWFEGNVATNQIISLGGMTSKTDIDGCYFTNNSAARHILYSSTEPGLSIKRCVFAFPGAAGFPIFDNAGVTSTLPGNGCVEWYDNVVTGGDAANKCVSGTEFRGGKTSPRLTLCGITNTPGTITDSSDPGATVSFNGVGDVSITSSHPFASATNKIRAIVTGQAANACRVQLVNASQVRVQLFTDAGAASDGVFSLVVYGS